MLTHTLPADFAEAMSASDAAGVAAAFGAAAFFAGEAAGAIVLVAAGAGAAAGAGLGAGVGVAAGAAIEFAAGAEGAVAAAAAPELDFLLFLEGVLLAEASAAGVLPEAASVVLLAAEDFLASAAGAEDASVASPFLLFLDVDDFFVPDVSVAAAELSVPAAAAFLDFFDFLVVVVEL
jgi:hypothetical protein